ncbi:MAG: hypothetical protein JXB34_00695 [Bacteroidales bacterium]|nr:hypothetical protein [Bacteroidales bacterium]
MKKTLLVFFFICTVHAVNAQIIKSKLDLVVGLSAREYFHAGARYQYAEIAQAGIYFGNDLELNASELITTFCIDNMVHFGKHSFYSNRPVWYARQGYTYLKNRASANETKKYSYIDLSAGRDFAFNDWLGLNIDIGFMVQFREKTEKNASTTTSVNNTLHTLPLARLQFYVSF